LRKSQVENFYNTVVKKFTVEPLCDKIMDPMRYAFMWTFRVQITSAVIKSSM